MSTFRPWPGSHVIALICCRKGDPHFVQDVKAKEENCYCCGQAIMVNPFNQDNKQRLGSTSEFICINCWHEYYSGTTRVMLRKIAAKNKANNVPTNDVPLPK